MNVECRSFWGKESVILFLCYVFCQQLCFVTAEVTVTVMVMQAVAHCWSTNQGMLNLLSPDQYLSPTPTPPHQWNTTHILLYFCDCALNYVNMCPVMCSLHWVSLCRSVNLTPRCTLQWYTTLLNDLVVQKYSNTCHSTKWTTQCNSVLHAVCKSPPTHQ